MARKPQDLSKQNYALGGEGDVFNNRSLLSAAIWKIDSNFLSVEMSEDGSFLLNPSSYEESKSSNWAPQAIPGQADPALNWVSGGPRTVTFEALVTRDSSGLDKKKSNPLSSIINSAVNVVGSIASTFAGVTMPPLGDLFNPSDDNASLLSITDKLNYYRSLLYPTYQNGFLVASPPLVVLAMGKTFQGAPLDSELPIQPAKSDSSYIPVWAVVNLNIRVTKQLPNLDPMEAYVTFTLNEYPLAPISSSNFTFADESGIPNTTDNTLGGLISGFLG